MVLDAFGVGFRGGLVEAEGEEQANDDAVAVARGLRGGAAGMGEEKAAIGSRFHQPVALQAGDGGGDGCLCDAEAVREIDGASLAQGIQKVGDEFDVILRHRRAVARARAGEARGLGVGCWQGGAGKRRFGGWIGCHGRFLT